MVAQFSSRQAEAYFCEGWQVMAAKAPKTMQERLEDRAEQLVALFLVESDPAKWPGTETREGRGDRLWLQRGAETVGRLAVRACQLKALVNPLALEDGERKSLAEMMTAAEDEAERLLAKMGERGARRKPRTRA